MDENKIGGISGDTPNSGVLDFSEEGKKIDQVAEVEVGIKYDSRPQEDTARRYIAYLLIGLLWAMIIGIFVLLYRGSMNVEDIKDFGVILSPIIALVSAATGFYYGTKSNVKSHTG